MRHGCWTRHVGAGSTRPNSSSGSPTWCPRCLCACSPSTRNAERELKRRTLTNLYNERPTWLAHLHDALDAAVFAAYGWVEAPRELGEEDLLGRLMALNVERGRG